MGMVGRARSAYCGRLRGGTFSLALRESYLDMLKSIRWLKPGWWLLHIAAIALTFYLGHAIRF
jgi:hypothetical protein